MQEIFHQEHIITSEFVRVEAPGLASREVLKSECGFLRPEELATFRLSGIGRNVQVLPMHYHRVCNLNSSVDSGEDIFLS